MYNVWANDFGEILQILPQRLDLRQGMIGLLPQPMPGMVTEGGDRIQKLRGILTALVNGALSLEEAYLETGHQLPRHMSNHNGNNRVFAEGWQERLIRTQLSRLYNQAVLEHLLAVEEMRCLVPHSSAEDPDSPCSRLLAGREHDTERLHKCLVDNYTKGQWSKGDKIPEHPHCTHVVRPVLSK